MYVVCDRASTQILEGGPRPQLVLIVHELGDSDRVNGWRSEAEI